MTIDLDDNSYGAAELSRRTLSLTRKEQRPIMIDLSQQWGTLSTIGLGVFQSPPEETSAALALDRGTHLEQGHKLFFGAAVPTWTSYLVEI